MTSKEKLLQLRHDFYNSEELNYDSIAYFTTVEKDLEVLEIIKKHLWFGFSSNGFQVYCGDTMDLGNEEDFNKVKEWVEKAFKNMGER